MARLLIELKEGVFGLVEREVERELEREREDDEEGVFARTP